MGGLSPAHAAFIGAVDETRTRDLHLGKVALYQLSYYRALAFRRQRKSVYHKLMGLASTFRKKLERVMGIEPTYPAWKAGALPLSYTRKSSPSGTGLSGRPSAGVWCGRRDSNSYVPGTPDPKSGASAIPPRPRKKTGDPAETRTPDPLIKSQMLCQLSYWVVLAGAAGFEPAHTGVKAPGLNRLATPHRPRQRQAGRRKKWGERWDLNPRFPGPQPGALTAELRPPQKPTGRKMARPKGFEPLTHGLEGRCSIRLSYGRMQSLEGTGSFIPADDS